MDIKKLGIVANIRKKDIREIISKIVDIIPDRIDIVGLKETADLLSSGTIQTVDRLGDCDVVLALGGDGTLLVASRLVEKEEVPLLGIKIRSLGFLTEDDPDRAINDLLGGRYRIQDRMRLEVSRKRDGAVRESFSALNDAVVHAVGVSRVIHLKITIDGVMIGEYLADGVIISTPTGSTAYSLAAGGPIVNPTSVEAFVITALCPHSLSVRPIVVSSNEQFTVEVVEGRQDILLTIDGQQACGIESGEHIVFKRSPRVTKLIVTEGYNFYDLVRRKLKWGGVLRQH